jgi:hypothetical protein
MLGGNEGIYGVLKSCVVCEVLKEFSSVRFVRLCKRVVLAAAL